MAGDNKSISIGRDAAGNLLVTGDKNKIESTIQASVVRKSLPPPASVDMKAELSRIRELLEKLEGENASKVRRALDDATEENDKTNPDKDEIGGALTRAIEYAKKGEDFADVLAKLAPHVVNAAAWLGSKWHLLLPMVGIAL